MTIEQVVKDLRQWLQSVSGSTTDRFLHAFEEIHFEWHFAESNIGRGTFQGSPIGFLSFHHEVVLVHNDLLRRNREPIPTAMSNPRPQYDPRIDAQPDPESFSLWIENWHGRVHTNPIYPPEFGDPRQNIYMFMFWQFHQLVEDKFMDWLQNNNISYDDVDHTVV
jgi:hypothetical protein